MANYKIVIQYDGTRYSGWQVQKNADDTIQGILENAISEVAGSHVDLIGSGRTDAGVHAIGQVANFHIDATKKTDSELIEQINSQLPNDIAVIDIEKVDGRFHARYNAVSKTYRYRIHTSNIANVFERRYAYYYLDKKLDVQKMREAAALMEGTHDFKSFCSNKHMKKSSVRTVTKIEITQDDSEIVIDYTGDGFLQNMIRIMTGTLIEVGNGSRDVNDITGILEGEKRELAGYTAPPQGLCLMKVEY